MKKVAVIFTGGTISMKVDQRLSAAIPALSSEEIMGMVTNIDRMAEIEAHEFSRLPGPHMNEERLFELFHLVINLLDREDIDGIVITHGTDTLEETAYFLDLLVDSKKPIVMVAAMRNSSELGYDGPSNLAGAISTAISDEARGMGVLIVLNNTVNAASEVTKSHTLSLDTFKSLEFGPLGIVDQNEVIFYRTIREHQTLHSRRVEKEVHLVKAALGMDGRMIDYLVAGGAKGLVIEAMGRGNLPPLMARSVIEAMDKGLVVVLVSRCPMGRVYDSYGYEGGGKLLRNAGVIFGGNLNGQKARMQLMLLLGGDYTKEEIKTSFERDFYHKKVSIPFEA